MSDIFTGVKKSDSEVVHEIKNPEMGPVPSAEKTHDSCKVKKMFRAASGMLAGATFNADVNINIHYMAAQISGVDGDMPNRTKN